MRALTLAIFPRHRPFRQLVTKISNRLALSKSRQRLARLDDHLLRDIGLTRPEAEAEAARTPWDAPPHWRRGES